MIVKLRLPGDEVVQEFTFHRTEALIGSSPRTDLYVPLEQVGLRHARLRKQGDRVWLEPLKPGQILVVQRAKVGRIKSSSPIGLLPGDTIILSTGTETATIEMISAGNETDLEPRSETLFRLMDEPCEPLPSLLQAVNQFAIRALDVTRKQDLPSLLQPVVEAITRTPHPPTGLVLFGTMREAPQFLIPETFHLLVSGTKALIALAEWRPRIIQRLCQGEVLLFPSDEDTHLVLVPITTPGGVVGFWCFIAPMVQTTSELASVAGAVSRLLLGALSGVDQALQLRALRAENQYFRARERRHYLFKELVTQSPAMKAAYDTVSSLVNQSTPVLILGEKGTGKEMIARALHHLSNRAGALMISQNCAGIPVDLLEEELFGRSGDPGDQSAGELKKGLLELTHGGTLFLEGIDRLPLTLQTKLTRVISEREVRPAGETVGQSVDVRLVVSTERDLFLMVQAGEFRKDLYLQLAENTIRLPPLRERREDIVPLANVFVLQLAPRYRKKTQRISESLQPMLMDYSWPGNVRELQGAIEAAIIAAPEHAEELVEIPGLAGRIARQSQGDMGPA